MDEDIPIFVLVKDQLVIGPFPTLEAAQHYRSELPDEASNYMFAVRMRSPDTHRVVLESRCWPKHETI